MRPVLLIAVLLVTLLPAAGARARSRCTKECQRVVGGAVAMCAGRGAEAQVACIEKLTADHPDCRAACGDDARLACLSDCQRARAAEVQTCTRQHDAGSEDLAECLADAGDARDACADDCGVDVRNRRR
jgi:hypothetical protein